MLMLLLPSGNRRASLTLTVKPLSYEREKRHIWAITREAVGGGDEGGLQGLQGDSDRFGGKKKRNKTIEAQAVTQHRSISLAQPPPVPWQPHPPHLPRTSPSRQSPSADYINKPRAGPRQRIMVHREVTGKENMSLRMAKSTRDKHREALRDLDKGLTNHVGNWTHFLKWERKKSSLEAVQLLRNCRPKPRCSSVFRWIYRQSHFTHAALATTLYPPC